ncbi:hypothetical protein FF2_046098 [Malus domestica]
MDNVKLKEVKPTHDALSLLIRAYAALDLRVDVANRVYDKMAERCDGEHLCMDNFSTCIMVKGLCKEGKVGEGDVKGANEIFKELKSKGFLPMLETFGAMINGYCEEGKFKAIDRLLMLMKERGLYINVQVHNNIVDARCKHDSLVKEVETVTKMIESGCEPDITTFHILIHNSCTGGKVQQAEQFINHAMERGLVPNEFSYIRQREHSRALDLFTRMTERGQKPDLVSYGALILGLLVSGEVDVAMTVRDRMMENVVVLDSRIYNVLMSGLCKMGRLPTAKLLLRQKIIFGLTTEKGLNPGVVEYNAMIKGLNPGVVEYNAMNKGFCKFGMMMDALSCFEKMQKVHHHPGEFAYSTIIDGYVKQHNLDATLSFFELMVKQGCKPNVVTKTSLIYGFCHKGDSCGDEGNRAKAASFFELMLKNKCIPNDVTFHYLVNGFTNTEPGAIPKEVNESQQNEKSICLGVFRRMISDGWFQKAAVYNSIIICLCHHGMGKTAIQLCEK